ncbi:MAG: 2-dehydro-3-deoxy-6-phosphogalactonate aldolase [Pseudomonadota bacterium]
MNAKRRTPTAPWPAFKRSLVAILRGVQPEEIIDIGTALVDAGFEAIEVPLNSPDPFTSIEALAKAVGDKCLVGAGTVLAADDVHRLASAGGRLMVSPNIDAEVMAAAAEHEMVTMPGVFTATEALAAIAHGATALKFFPASTLGPDGINAIKAVLPSDMVIGAVGGVSHADFERYMQIGVTAFGLGSSIYKPGLSAVDVSQRAEKTIAAYDKALSDT